MVIFQHKGVLVCEDCGGYYGRKVWHSNDAYEKSFIKATIHKDKTISFIFIAKKKSGCSSLYRGGKIARVGKLYQTR